MGTITMIDRNFIRAFRAEAVAALQAVADKYGMSVEAEGGARFSASDLHMKFRIALRDAETGETPNADAKNFALYASMYGLEAGDLGRTFRSAGSVYKITGINPRRPQYPISATREPDGKKFKMPAHSVKQALATA